MNNENKTRLLELLSDRKLGNLDPVEAEELGALSGSADVDKYESEFELAAAAIALSEMGAIEPMPTHLEQQIAAGYSAQVEGSPPREIVIEPATRFPILGWLGWLTAAAACVALAVNIYVSRGETGREVAKTLPTPSPSLSLEQLRQHLIDTSSDIVRAQWSKGNLDTTANVSGDIVWSDDRQAGYMKLTALPVNDSNKETYQLWIFDKYQSEKTPIDGGTFNVTSTGEVIVPIDAKLRAREPSAFAITIEQPGGVVVSDRKRVAALAQLKPGPA